MQIDKTEIKIKELVAGYTRDEESSQVVAYADSSGVARLNIRPKYQREFVYKEAQRNAVIDTILKGFPLNIMYWVKNVDFGAECEYEVLDGQQRTISICEYVKGSFSIQWNDKSQYFHTLSKDLQEKFLDYKLNVYVCQGSESEKLEWFKTINIAGETLTNQELRNAVYASVWLSDAKRRFSKPNGLAVQRGAKYLSGSALRQEFLESAIAWKVDSRKDEKICEYMAKNAKDSKNADELWEYFAKVIDWVEMKFEKYRKEMKGLEWGLFYNTYKDKPLDAKELESKIIELMQDDEVGNKKGVYAYVLSGDEKHLSLRAFSESVKRAVYEKQGGVCANSDGHIKGVKCPHENERLELEQMEADHILAWSKGGKTEKENCQMLCRECNRKKSAK
ncbi:HNH endonuclease family protein [Campylobacter upsaliensis]